jgi:hypothetical protein
MFFVEPVVVGEDASGTRLITITRLCEEAVGDGVLELEVSLKDVAVANARKFHAEDGLDVEFVDCCCAMSPKTE